MEERNHIKVLLVGYLPPPIGGVTVLFKQLINYLNKHNDLSIDVINLSKTNKTKINSILFYLYIILTIPFNIYKNDLITFHATASSAFKLGPIIYFWTKLFKKKLIIRKFGGTFHKSYQNKSPFVKWVMKKTICNADLWLFETKELVDFFDDYIERTKWYPNSRELQEKKPINTSGANNFVFISQIKKEKGVKEIFAISNELPKEIKIDLFGPLGYNISEEEIRKLNKTYKATYEGCLNPSEVIGKLKEYDVLLLPTYHEGEGYPGIILEAYSCGIPVITTDWNSINEIVSEVSGILIEPQNIEQLKNTILKINNDLNLYKDLADGAYEKGKFFSANKWSNEFVKICEEVYKNDL